jgi:hypothetical protein
MAHFGQIIRFERHLLKGTPSLPLIKQFTILKALCPRILVEDRCPTWSKNENSSSLPGNSDENLKKFWKDFMAPPFPGGRAVTLTTPMSCRGQE